MPNREPQINLTQIDFPSDRLTIRALRRLFPALFDEGAEVPFLNDTKDNNLRPMLAMERALAHRAFAEVLGEASKGDWDDQRVELGREYIRLGLADGPHQAQLLIRSFEQSAADQARPHAKSRHF